MRKRSEEWGKQKWRKQQIIRIFHLSLEFWAPRYWIDTAYTSWKVNGHHRQFNSPKIKMGGLQQGAKAPSELSLGSAQPQHSSPLSLHPGFPRAGDLKLDKPSRDPVVVTSLDNPFFIRPVLLQPSRWSPYASLVILTLTRKPPDISGNHSDFSKFYRAQKHRENQHDS